MGFLAMFPLSWTTLRGKYWWHPIAIMGVVDTFGPYQIKIHHHGLKWQGSNIDQCVCTLLQPPQFFAEQLTRGADFAQHSTSSPSVFSDLETALTGT